jgi:hypothetical protein
MLSVQNLPRCAGMERFGIPTSTTIGPSHSQRDERLIKLRSHCDHSLKCFVDTR